jgi:hypothetical protein
MLSDRLLTGRCLCEGIADGLPQHDTLPDSPAKVRETSGDR